VSATQLRELLLSRGRAWPGPIESFEVLGSTNDELRERARLGAPAWSVVIADRQTAGRGRRGHAWASLAGNLHASVLVAAPERPEARTLLPLVAGLSVAEALVEFRVDARLKWPNDVVVGGRKLAGVLAEASSGGAGPDFAVLGIGVNVCVDPAGLVAALEDRATSIAGITGAFPDRLVVAAAVLARLADRYADLEAGGRGLLDAWRARSLPWWGRPVQVVSGEEAVRGLAVDVDEAGGLVLRLANGDRRTLLAGEARELRLDETG
jgi:BirA family biotin operon repressor/biotin-[acetyl-CoA-carboxylase] ligase